MATVDRQMVFHTTMVRAALRKDGSWIRNTLEDPLSESPDPVKPDLSIPDPRSPAPLSPAPGRYTPTSPGWRERKGGSYVPSEMKRTEGSSPGSSPGSSGLTQTDAAKKPETTKDAKVTLADSAETPELHTPAAKTPEIPEIPVISPVPVRSFTPVAKTFEIPEISPVPVRSEVYTPAAKTPEIPVISPAPETAVPVARFTTPEGKSAAQEVTSTVVGAPVEESFSPPKYISRSARRSITSSVAKAPCAFCNTPVEGNVKISISDPPIRCHAHCFKCATCSKPLGDMKSSMFHHEGRIYCERCFDHIFFH